MDYEQIAYNLRATVRADWCDQIAAADELLEAMDSLFEHCAMVHKHWGEGSNKREADAAIERARAAVAKARGSA